VEKGRWRRSGGEAYSYSPVLHCCYLVLTADWLLAVCITATYVKRTFDPHIVTDRQTDVIRTNKTYNFYINILM
jgi:hypothetical protein